MNSPATCRNDKPTLEAQREAIQAIERELWNGGLNESRLPAYQAAFRQLEDSIAAQGPDERHDFVIFVPVADRPQHLADCLESTLALCRAFGYGGQDEQGRYRKVSVIVADDSKEAAHLARNRELAGQYSRQGLATTCFGPEEQVALLDALARQGVPAPLRVVGNAPRDAFGHKGQAIMRNIAYLALNQQESRHRRILFYSIDSDQEFKVKVSTAEGEQDVCAVNFLYQLDRIFSSSDALLLTGKVVGDPPVSPAVMTGNFLDDVIAFLQSIATGGPGPCRHHQTGARKEGEAAYHDMADLFGFASQGESYRYRCPLPGDHGDAECFDHFSGKLNAFFYGEHPTRASYYVHDEIFATVQPARTVYAGNYVMRPEALVYFIPFGALRLRMSGPTLGRIVRAEIGRRFVSANLPMLHKRTVQDTGQSEFRPGILSGARAIDFSDEFERQFYGDVMLFSMERLTTASSPLTPPPDAEVLATLEAVRHDMLGRYNQKRRAVMGRLGELAVLVKAPHAWWNQNAARAGALENFQAFIANVAHNFGPDSACHGRLNGGENWLHWRARLLDAIRSYPEDRASWEHTLAVQRAGKPAS